MRTEKGRTRVGAAPFPQAPPDEPARCQFLRNAVVNWRLLLRTNTLLLPYLALIFAVMVMGSSAIFVKWANVPGPVFGFYRMAIAITLCSLLFKWQAQRSSPWSRRHLWLAAFGGLFLAIDLWLWNDAVLTTSAANANLFGNTSVIWVALGAMVLFNERLRPAFWGGLLLALVGIVVILGQDSLAHPTLGLGDVMALLAGVFYAIFFLATARARDQLNAFVAWWLSSLASAVALLAIALALQQPFVGYSMQAYACILAVAVLTQVGGYLSVNYALGHLPASLVSLTLLGQPVITALLGVPLLGQAIDLAQIIGGVSVLAGIVIVHLTSQKR
jgi:drug/metabolite transporter (DMT)-like permease